MGTCKGITKSGTPCKRSVGNLALDASGKGFCSKHFGQTAQEANNRLLDFGPEDDYDGRNEEMLERYHSDLWERNNPEF